MHRFLSIAALTACIAGSLAAQSQPHADREAFKIAVAKIDTEVFEAQENFSRVLDPFQDGKAGDPAEVRAAYDRFAAAVQSGLNRIPALETPDNDCRDFAAVLRDFLSALHDHVQPELEKIVVQVEEKHGKLDLLAKLEIIASLKKCDDVQQPLRARLMDAARRVDGDQTPPRIDRDAFRKAVDKIGEDLEEARRSFNNALDPFVGGKPGDPADVRAAYDRFSGALQNALDQTATLAPDSGDCRDFLAAFRNFLTAFHDRVQPELKNIVAKVEEKQGKLDLVEQLETIASLKKCDAALQPFGERLQSAAREMDRADKASH